MPLFCLVFNCPNKKSKRKDLTFCRVPKIIKNQGEETERMVESISDPLKHLVSSLCSNTRVDPVGNLQNKTTWPKTIKFAMQTHWKTRLELCKITSYVRLQSLQFIRSRKHLEIQVALHKMII